MTAAAKPSLRELTFRLHQLHEAWSHPDAGGEYVSMMLEGWENDSRWTLWIGPSFGRQMAGREYIPGDGARFDAVAAARRLLAAIRDHEHP